MMTKSDAELVALDAHAARPEWGVVGIMAALLAVRDRDPEHVRAAALHAARNPTNRTPAIIAMDGPHWTLTAPARRAGKSAKCPKHDVEESSEGVCRCCRADRLARGDEHPIGPPGHVPHTVEGRCCGHPHAPAAPCPGHVGPPEGWHQMIEAAANHYRKRAPAHMQNLITREDTP